MRESYYFCQNETYRSVYVPLIAYNLSSSNYVFTADIDRAKCISTKKDIIKSKVTNIDESKIIVVIQEIESWYARRT